ncbi:alternative oxidase [Angomonas deanei]|uniref:Alternative oxidase n=1 Tax=Angomonas deanei TaxID=59799 RepID=A0A7G2BZN3_9TRYP|nr:alternative oxidase [Angomonas deanei]CAD2212998.1 Alternative oxidase, putative [Angomonas deanei]|eukprot:EPY24741.1 alternative oxidase [Angomonas deanei]
MRLIKKTLNSFCSLLFYYFIFYVFVSLLHRICADCNNNNNIDKMTVPASDYYGLSQTKKKIILISKHVYTKRTCILTYVCAMISSPGFRSGSTLFFIDILLFTFHLPPSLSFFFFFFLNSISICRVPSPIYHFPLYHLGQMQPTGMACRLGRPWRSLRSSVGWARAYNEQTTVNLGRHTAGSDDTTAGEAPQSPFGRGDFSPKSATRGILSSRLRRKRFDSDRRSPLYASFMGSSTRFNPASQKSSPLSRATIQELEREPLSHSPPSYLNDHVCILMVKALRWLSDRCFRERFLHRATMLLTVASAAPAAGAVAAYLRMSCASNQRLDSAPYVPQPQSLPGDRVVGERNNDWFNNYADELRGLLSQSECHAVHYQVMVSMANIMPVERGLVLLLQTFHFLFFFALFLVYPRMGFRLMGYLGEESSVVWTQMVNDIDLGKIAECKVPQLAVTYWGLHDGFRAQEAPLPAVVEKKEKKTPKETEKETPKEEEEKSSAEVLPKTEATEEKLSGPSPPKKVNKLDTLTLRDIVLLIRSDEMVYRDLNHRLADQLDAAQRKRGNPIFDTLLKKF